MRRFGREAIQDVIRCGLGAAVEPGRFALRIFPALPAACPNREFRRGKAERSCSIRTKASGRHAGSHRELGNYPTRGAGAQALQESAPDSPPIRH
jgi:hypothetical protein